MGSEIRTLLRIRDCPSGRLQYCQDSKRIYTYDTDDGFKSWEIASGTPMFHAPKAPAIYKIQLAFSFDARCFALHDHVIQL